MAHIEQSPSGLDIVVFGGGGGGSVMVGGFVEAMPDATITAIAPTGDSGSKTGVIREVFGGPAIGDTRKILGALASPDSRPLFDDSIGRFGKDATLDTVKSLNEQLLAAIDKQGIGTDRAASILDQVVEQTADLPGALRGHTYTNLVLNGLRLSHKGRLNPAIAEMHTWVGAPDRVTVLGVTEESHNVVMYDKIRHRTLIGEGVVDDYEPANSNHVEVWLEAGKMENRVIDDPQEALHYYLDRRERRRPIADATVVGRIALSNGAFLSPGSRDTSLKPVLYPDGVSDGLDIQRRRGGLFVAVTNLTEEKPGMSLPAHLRTVREASGRGVTHFIYNTDTNNLPKGEVPVKYDPESFDIGDAVAIGEKLVDSHEVEASANDPIAHLRSKSHHNVWRIAEVVQRHILPKAPTTVQQA